MNYEIIHHPEENRFDIEIEGMNCHADYRLTDNSLDIIHTYVPKALEGKGIAGALTKATYEYALSQGLKPVATCSYAEIWLERHPEFLCFIT